MYVLRIEHPVPDYDGWKRAFDADPLNRKGSGVRRFAVFRSSADANHVLVDLEFDTLDQAQAMLSALETMWGKVEGTLMSNARARIVTKVEDVDL